MLTNRYGCDGRLAAGLLVGLHNYFIQEFYPAITATTDGGEAILGWFTVLISIVISLLFWHMRHMLPKMPRPEGGL